MVLLDHKDKLKKLLLKTLSSLGISILEMKEGDFKKIFCKDNHSKYLKRKLSK